jgi:type IV secretory pathway VirJ component
LLWRFADTVCDHKKVQRPCIAARITAYMTTTTTTTTTTNIPALGHRFIHGQFIHTHTKKKKKKSKQKQHKKQTQTQSHTLAELSGFVDTVWEGNNPTFVVDKAMQSKQKEMHDAIRHRFEDHRVVTYECTNKGLAQHTHAHTHTRTHAESSTNINKQTNTLTNKLTRTNTKASLHDD